MKDWQAIQKCRSSVKIDYEADDQLIAFRYLALFKNNQLKLEHFAMIVSLVSWPVILSLAVGCLAWILTKYKAINFKKIAPRCDRSMAVRCHIPEGLQDASGDGFGPDHFSFKSDA